MRWVVGHTWDGGSLPEGEQAVVTVAFGASRVVVEVEAPFHGDPPPPGPPGPTDRLWEHEVVEWFVVGPGAAYTELELSPWGHHLLLRLEGVRRPVASLLPVAFVAERTGDRWRGRAEIDRACFPASPVATNAYRIHGQGAQRRYLAHAPVPGPHPDFHRLEAFAPWPTER